jgi:hypothetical protein
MAICCILKNIRAGFTLAAKIGGTVRGFYIVSCLHQEPQGWNLPHFVSTSRFDVGDIRAKATRAEMFEVDGDMSSVRGERF